MYGLVYGFEDAGDQEIVLEFYNDGLVCESFEDREDQLSATFRFDRRLWDGWWELTIVADAEEKRSVDHFSDFGDISCVQNLCRTVSSLACSGCVWVWDSYPWASGVLGVLGLAGVSTCPSGNLRYFGAYQVVS